MFILLLKSAAQLGLFEKIVPVKGSVHSDGKFTKPHYARRRVKLQAEAQAQPDLFSAPPPPPKPKAKAKEKPKPEETGGDLFDLAPPPPVKQAEKPLTLSESKAAAALEQANAETIRLREKFAKEDAAEPEKPALSDRDRREMYRDMIDTKKRNGEPVPERWVQAEAELTGKLGEDKPAPKPKPEPVDRTGWSEARNLAYDLRQEWENKRPDTLDGRALGAFKRKLRAVAKKVPADDDAAVMLVDYVSAKVWGGDYDPKVAAVEFAPAASESKAAPAPNGLYDGPFDPDKVPAFGVKAGTSKEARRRINAEAAELVNNEYFTAAQKDLLRQYSGNGGCGDSLNEYYTDPGVAAAMWYTLRGLGLGKDATVLEPSCATGVYLTTAPAGVKVQGVELEPISAKIGAILHPDHAVENASLERFATQDVRQFDAVIGNVPFGIRGSLIKDDKPELKTAEAYFVDTALDKTKPGGVVALIVPTGLLDGKNSRAVRERLLRKAEFLGALRMPNTAFEHSHTEVTSDIVYFRKRPQDVAGALMTVKQDVLRRLGVWDEDYLAGTYFRGGRGAANVLGTMKQGWRAEAGMGDDITVEGDMQGVPEHIAAFRPAPVGDTAQPTMQQILDALGSDEKAKARAITASLKQPYDHAKAGDTKTVDGITYVLQGKPPRWHRVDEYLQSPAVTEGQELARLIDARMQGNESRLSVAMGGLADRVREYVKKYGIPAKNPDLQIALSQDKTLYRLIGAVHPDGSLSDVVEGRKAEPVESTFEAAALSLATDHGSFTPEQVAARWQQGDAETARDHLYASADFALDPTDGTWTSVDQYLSGQLWPKFDAVKAKLAGGEMSSEDRAKYERQARLLEETIDPRVLDDVEVNLNSAFLPLRVVAAFFNDKAAERAKESGYGQPDELSITFDKGIYSLKGGSYETSLLEKYLNRSGVKKDDMPTINRWNEEFQAWLCASRFRDEIEELYNRRFRGFRQRAYSNKPFEVPGLNPEMVPNSYQWEGLRWALEAGKGIIAADVGLGKTPRGLMLVKLLKTTGRAKRPMIVVPKSVLANWVAEAERWFPGSRLMVIGETYSKDKKGNLKVKQDSAAERNRKLHEITQNDYDFILISQPAWNDLDVDPITKGEYADQDFWAQRGDAQGDEGNKRLKKIRAAHDQALAQRDFKKRTDALFFNDLGIDAIIGDEFHAYKNLYSAKQRFGDKPKFLGGQGQSNRAQDMFFKSKWVREHGGTVYGMTATPTKNSPLEIYSMLSHIDPAAFENIGIRNSEEFLDRFCEFKEDNYLTTEGTIKRGMITSGFKNMNELRDIMRRYIDRKTAADVGLKLPQRDDRMHMVDMSPEQEKVYTALRALAAEAKGGDATGDGHIFSIMDKMSKTAMDLELYDPEAYKGAESPKYNAAIKEIVAGTKDGGQIVFAENLAVHDKLRDKLVAAGIPRERIGIVNADVAKSSASRQEIADALNNKKLDVVIGNATMSEGMNMQKNTADIHHLDLPWEPASVQQRNGRGLRQGNKLSAIRIHTYLAKGSFDGYRYQSLSAKKDWQDLLWNGGDRVENLAREGNLSRDDLLIMLSADPDAARAQFAENKAAAQERYDSSKREEAAKAFGRFKELKASYGSLKNKESATANRLRIKLEQAKTALFDNPFFEAKHALDSNQDIFIHPQTGRAFEAGKAFEIPDSDDASIKGGGKFVAVSVDPRTGEVTARRYGALAAPLELGIEDLKTAKPVEYSEADEKAELHRNAMDAAKTQLADVGSMRELASLPPAAIEAAYAPLQKHIKEGLTSYRFHHGQGDVGLIDPQGKAVAVPSYDARGSLSTHDVLLPIPAHRDKAMAAWMEHERAKEFGTEYAPTGRRGRNRFANSIDRVVFKYPGRFGLTSNPMGSLGKEIFGDQFEREAKATFTREQVGRARHANTFSMALKDVAPTVGLRYSGGAIWPKRGLAVLWAKAKREKILDRPLKANLPKSDNYYDTPDLPMMLFASNGDQSRAHHGNVGETLIGMAKDSGHTDLAAAMIVSSGGDPTTTASELLKLGVSPPVISGLRHLVEKHPGMGWKKLHELNYSPVGAGGMTLEKFVEANDGDEGGGDEREAA